MEHGKNYYLITYRQIFKQLLITNYTSHPWSLDGQAQSLTRKFGSNHIYGCTTISTSRMVNTFLLTRVNQYILDYEMFIMLMPNHFSGYPTLPYVICPFDEHDIAEASEIDVPHMRQFNKQLSSIRIASEHAFGHLKGCFPSLKEMGSHKDIEEMYKSIEAMMTLHNISTCYPEPCICLMNWYLYVSFNILTTHVCIQIFIVLIFIIWPTIQSIKIPNVLRMVPPINAEKRVELLNKLFPL